MNKEIMINAGFGDMVKKVEQGLCPFCKKPINIGHFKDNLSIKEFQISGLCQKCDFFGT